jgi:predicted nucleic acid-binding protein
MLVKALFDSSVWIEHFKQGRKDLRDALEADTLVLHSKVFLELAMGSIPDRAKTLKDLKKLESISSVSDSELFRFIEMHRLYNTELSVIDAELLASCLVAEVRFVTLDKKLRKVWERLS